MAENFTLMDKVIDPKKFTFEEAARIATLEKWRSWFGMGFAEREWNEAFYLMVKGESITLTEFKKEGKKNRIFDSREARLLIYSPFNQNEQNWPIRRLARMSTYLCP